MKVWRNHKCERQHAKYQAFIKCAIRGVLLIGDGDGPYATISWCGRVTSVTLWDTPEDAEAALGFINRAGCGGLCTRHHEVVQLALQNNSYENYMPARQFAAARRRTGELEVSPYAGKRTANYSRCQAANKKKNPTRGELNQTQTDADGDHWHVTGHWCRVCHWPLHPTHARHGEDTHPTCDTTPPVGDLYTTPQRQPRPIATTGSPDDPGYCRLCGMTRPRHTSRCATRKETQ